MTATHWTTANLRDRSGIVKKRMDEENAKGEREGSVIENEGLSENIQTSASFLRPPVQGREAQARGQPARALVLPSQSPASRAQASTWDTLGSPLALLSSCSRPVQAPSKCTCRPALYQPRSHLQKCTVCHGKKHLPLCFALP